MSIIIKRLIIVDTLLILFSFIFLNSLWNTFIFQSVKGEKLLELGNYVEVEETLLRKNVAEVEDSGISHAIQYQVG